MSLPSADSRTPGRRAGAPSNLARADLLRRLLPLALPPEVVPRLVRLIEEEVEQAVAARARHTFTAEEVLAIDGGDAFLAALQRERAEQERVAAIRAAGLQQLSAAELAAVLAETRAGEGA